MMKMVLFLKLMIFNPQCLLFPQGLKAKNIDLIAIILKKKKKKKKNHSNKKVEFNPFITVVNIESFKKENYEGTFDAEQRCTEELFNNKNVKKCILCSIF